MTPSEIKAGLNKVAKEIRDSRRALKRSQTHVIAAQNALDSIPNRYSELITAIDDLPGDDSFEVFVKDEKAALAAEFNALLGKAQSAGNHLSAFDFDS